MTVGLNTMTNAPVEVVPRSHHIAAGRPWPQLGQLFAVYDTKCPQATHGVVLLNLQFLPAVISQIRCLRSQKAESTSGFFYVNQL